MKFEISPKNQSSFEKKKKTFNSKGKINNMDLELTWFNKVESFDPS